MLAGARVTPNPYRLVPVALFGTGVLMTDAERTTNVNVKKAKLLATRVSLTAIRRLLVSTPELP